MGRCIGRERIGLAQALESCSMQLGQTFDVLAHAHKSAETGHAQRMLVSDEGALEMPAHLRIAHEQFKRVPAQHLVRKLAHRLACSLDAPADRVRREEAAQEDPEPFHAEKLNRRMGRLIQGGCVLQTFGRRV